MNSIEVLVVGAITGDPICTVEADPGWCLQELKEAIKGVSGIPTHEQRLQVGGKPFSNEDKRLSEVLGDQDLSIELIRADAERTAALELLAVGGSLTQLKESYRRVCVCVCAHLGGSVPFFHLGLKGSQSESHQFGGSKTIF